LSLGSPSFDQINSILFEISLNKSKRLIFLQASPAAIPPNSSYFIPAQNNLYNLFFILAINKL
jgi:hypothetical protein